jgi:hypothetical protein
MPIVVMLDPIIVPLPVYYGASDTRYGRPVFPKTGLFYIVSFGATIYFYRRKNPKYINFLYTNP